MTAYQGILLSTEGFSPRARRALLSPSLEDFPLPVEATVNDRWPPVLEEMAAHIGAANVLRICHVLGGSDIYIPKEPAISPFLGLVDDYAVRTLAHVYGCERLALPAGNEVLRIARRSRVIATIRAGGISVSAAAQVLNTPRRSVSHLVCHTNEGMDAQPIAMPEPRIIATLRSAAELATGALQKCGASNAMIVSTAQAILDLWLDYKFPKEG